MASGDRRDSQDVGIGPDTPLLIDGRAASRILNISERTLQTLASSGAIPSRKLRNLRRYVPSELARWVADGCPSQPHDSRAEGEGRGT